MKNCSNKKSVCSSSAQRMVPKRMLLRSNWGSANLRSADRLLSNICPCKNQEKDNIHRIRMFYALRSISSRLGRHSVPRQKNKSTTSETMTAGFLPDDTVKIEKHSFRLLINYYYSIFLYRTPGGHDYSDSDDAGIMPVQASDHPSQHRDDYVLPVVRRQGRTPMIIMMIFLSRSGGPRRGEQLARGQQSSTLWTRFRPSSCAMYNTLLRSVLAHTQRIH